ncbi:hypothetical protein TNIN_349911 [Trichonephila inaurata madagascariensis]|uniref:Uncharacterized protein n=1 Tax=Trichonephila inaurata madagascariensis TaxID=2747483 RepID=A0A8X6IRH7_9ARAC|nr:hypothetical protein TNIN_349911 [Trichonephila inaurata madagascariensis]
MRNLRSSRRAADSPDDCYYPICLWKTKVCFERVCVCMREWPQHIWVMRSSSLPLHFPSLLENDWCVIMDSPPLPHGIGSFVGLF